MSQICTAFDWTILRMKLQKMTLSDYSGNMETLVTCIFPWIEMQESETVLLNAGDLLLLDITRLRMQKTPWKRWMASESLGERSDARCLHHEEKMDPQQDLEGHHSAVHPHVVAGHPHDRAVDHRRGAEAGRRQSRSRAVEADLPGADLDPTPAPDLTADKFP